MKDRAVILHNIRSAHNVGSIFRTADAAGARKVFLSGYTPTPINTYGAVQKDIAKTALGAEKYLEWSYIKSPRSVIAELKKEGWEVVGVEQDARAIDYRNYKQKKNAVFLFGNEVKGLSPELRKVCDVIVEIPMQGKKESLNVSVAAGIILFNN